jgi:two-component system OmpR family sensor kinase
VLSFRQRLVLIHWIVIVVIVACAAAAGWWQLSRSVYGQLDAALLALAETEAGMLAENEGQPVRVHERRAGSTPPSLTRLDRLVQIVNNHDQLLARSANLGDSQLPPPSVSHSDLAAGEPIFETLPTFGEEPLRMVSLPALSNGKLVVIQVAGSLDDARHVLESASFLFGIMAVLLLAFVGGAGAMLTRRVFHAIDDVVRQARHIGDTNLGARLPHPGTDDEIGNLVDTLNAMLDRLEHAFDQQRRFTADASHELRSPLSRLRMEIEVTLRRPRDAQEYVDTLRSCLDEVGRLTLLIEELLVLARLDAGDDRRGDDAVALGTIVAETLRRAATTARERHVELVVGNGAAPDVCVAHGATGVVLANLVENALKFAPAHSKIQIDCATDGPNALVTVTDHGPGIPEPELPFVFDRFFRGAGARASASEGVGLGLALSQALAGAYGGRIEAGNAPAGGAVFRVRMPRIVSNSTS